MSNGGYKGSSPARETSPEQYPGVWELTEQFQAQADGNWPFQETDCAPKSLRFDGSSAYLSRTPTANSNRRTFTWSGWVKRAKLSEGGSYYPRLFATARTTDKFEFNFMHDDTLRLELSVGAVVTTQVFRDISSFYHIVLAVDTTEGSNSDRVKMYVNGERVTSFSSYDSISQNFQTGVNTTQSHAIGRYEHSSSEYFDGGISEVHFIDGQALSCDEFGFFDGQGIWQPKRFTGDYASGLSYSNHVVLGGSLSGGSVAALFNGNSGSCQGASIAIGNTLTLNYVIPNVTKIGIHSNTGTAFKMKVNEGLSDEYDVSVPSQNNVTTLDEFTGFSGTIKSIKFYNVGAGLCLNAIEINGVQLIDASVGLNSFHLDFSDGAKDQSGMGNDWTLNNINAVAHTASYSSAQGSNITSAEAAKVFDTDDSDYGVATGDLIGFAYSGNSVEMKIQNTDTTQTNLAFYIQPYVSGGATNSGSWSNPSVGTVSSNVWNIPANSTGTATFTFPSGYDGVGRLYLSGWSSAFRMYSMKAGAAETDDLLVDSPVNGNQTDPSGLGGIVQGNYATLNPLQNINNDTFSDGNLKVVTNGGNYSVQISTIATPLTGKWYAEVLILSTSGYDTISIVPTDATLTSTSWGQNIPNAVSYGAWNGSIFKNQSSVATGSTFTTNDIIGIAYDADNSTVVFYKNNVPQPTVTSVAAKQFFFASSDYDAAAQGAYIWNFGQSPFKHPLAGYKSLCTSNLPEPSIPVPSQYFDAKLFNAANGTQTVSGYNFSPDLVWTKSRDNSYAHQLWDQVRGANKALMSNELSTEANLNNSLAFTSDGFTSGTNNNANYGSGGSVAWAWSAGDATTTIAVNSIRAVQNVTAGNDFSAGWAGFNQSFWANTDSWSNLPARNGNAKGYWPNTETLSDGHVFNSPDFGSISSGTGGHVLRASSSCTLKFTVYSHITEIAITTSDSQTFADRTIIATNPTANSIVEATGKCFWFSTTSAVPNIGAIGTVNNAPALPSLASTVRSSPESGFSIVTWTGGGATASIGTGLNSEPHFVIVKNRTGAADNWSVYTKTSGGGKQIYLNLTDDAESGSVFPTAPTNAVINIGGGYVGTGIQSVAYCFSPVNQYSAMGSYIADVNNPPFIHLGFRPKWIMIKAATDTTYAAYNSWLIIDAERYSYNGLGSVALYANGAYAEGKGGDGAASTVDWLDILSNGFKIRCANTEVNYSGTYVYLAFAESPFKNARAR